MSRRRRWLCVQIGRREHYAVARSLQRAGQNVHLVTDLWRDDGIAGIFQGALSRRFAERCSPEPIGQVSSFNASGILFELRARLGNRHGFSKVLERNSWFEEQMERCLRKLKNPPEIIFSYSYASGAVASYARGKGIPFILGQIDGGRHEEDHLRQFGGAGFSAPPEYWDRWRREVDEAAVVVVNSAWSAACMDRSCCRPKRVEVVPLGFEPGPRPAKPEREPVPPLSPERPLRGLFLGQIIRRKGVVELLNAITICRANGMALDVTFVGGGDEALINRIRQTPGARYLGAATAGETAGHYQAADVFILPTHSDGFALTQLEAQSWGVPVIASRNCGQVVRPGENGLVLATVTAEAIAEALIAIYRSPSRLNQMIRASGVSATFSLESIGKRYVEIGESIS